MEGLNRIDQERQHNMIDYEHKTVSVLCNKKCLLIFRRIISKRFCPQLVVVKNAYFKFGGRHLGLSTSGFFRFGHGVMRLVALDSWTPKT